MISADTIGRRWNNYWYPESNGLNLAICRIVVVGACLLFFFPPLQTHLELLEYNDGLLHPPKVQRFFATLFGESNWRSPGLFTTMHWVTVTCGILTVVGYRTRVAAAVFAVGYLALVTHRWSYGTAAVIGPIKPMDTANALFFLLLPLAPCGRRLSVDAWLRQRRGSAPDTDEVTTMAMWTVRLSGVLLGLIYLSAGWSKIENGGIAWLDGNRVRNMNFHRGVMLDMDIAQWISQHALLAIGISIFIVGFEVFFITGVIWPRTMPYWIVIATMFHLGTWYVYRNHYHFLSWVVLYVVYVDFEKLIDRSVDKGVAADSPPLRLFVGR